MRPHCHCGAPVQAARTKGQVAGSASHPGQAIEPAPSDEAPYRSFEYARVNVKNDLAQVARINPQIEAAYDRLATQCEEAQSLLRATE